MDTETHDEDAKIEAMFERRVAADDAMQAALDAVGLGGHGDYQYAEGMRYPVNVAALMRQGVPPPPMLLDRWLVTGELHWVYAEAECAKTWLALVWARELMALGNRVVWFDEELGERTLVERLLALGVDADCAETLFAYFPFPSWQMTAADVQAHALLLKKSGAALVVYDTATDVLAEAGLDEDSGKDVTAWVKAYPERARQLGVTQVVLDHTAKNSGTTRGKYAVGSRAKRAKAKVAYALSQGRADRFDREKVGKLTIELTKNTRGAEIPTKRKFRVGGGHGQPGMFAWQEIHIDLDDADGHDAPTTDLALRDRILKAVEQAGEVSTGKLIEAVGGKAARVRNTAAALAGLGLLEQEVGGPGKATVYRPARRPETEAETEKVGG